MKNIDVQLQEFYTQINNSSKRICPKRTKDSFDRKFN